MTVSTGVFAHLNAPNSEQYRRVLAVFVEAKERFRLHMRPSEILSAAPELSAADVSALLAYLVDHGNLIATQDTADVRTVEDFYKARFLYQLSRAGEAAEEALAHFYARLKAPAELQTKALADIRAHLIALQDLLTKTPQDAARIHQTINPLFARFSSLAEQARSFIGSLRRSLDFQALPVEDFLIYKEHLVGYLERFLQELAISSGDIVVRLEQLDTVGIGAALDAAADRALADQLRQDDEARLAERQRWRGRWLGLKGWFVGGQEPAQAQLLRQATRTAIPALLQALDRMHDRRLNRSDRAADYRMLARWFAQAPADAYAHSLWRAAFLLSSCRHLTIDEETLAQRDAEPVDPATSWLDDQPMRIHPRLRAGGRLSSPGRRPFVLDHGLAKDEMRRRQAEEAAQMERAREMIATGKARRLSDFSGIGDKAFGLMLDCLGAALARRTNPAEVIQCSSSDGSLTITCEPVEGSPEVALVTECGVFRGPDVVLTIADSWSEVPA